MDTAKNMLIAACRLAIAVQPDNEQYKFTPIPKTK